MSYDDDPLRYLAERVKRLSSDLRGHARLVKATVTRSNPLQIKFDEDSSPLAITPETLVRPLRVGEKVVAGLQDGRLTVLAVFGRSGSTLHGPAAQRAATVPSFGDMWRDTDGQKYLWKGSDRGVWRRASGVGQVGAGSWDTSGGNIWARTVSVSIPTALEPNETLECTITGVGNGFGAMSLSTVETSNWVNISTAATMRHYQFHSAQTNGFGYIWKIVER